MATFRDHLNNAAKEIAERSISSISDLERKMADIEKQKLEAEAARHKARNALQRLAEFPVQAGPDFLCPVCWMDYRISKLSPVGSDTSEDIFRCHECHWEISIS